MPPCPAKFKNLTSEEAWELLVEKYTFHPERYPWAGGGMPDWTPPHKKVIAAIRRMKIGKTFTATELRLRAKKSTGGVGSVVEEALRLGILDYTGLSPMGGRLYYRAK